LAGLDSIKANSASLLPKSRVIALISGLPSLLYMLFDDNGLQIKFTVPLLLAIAAAPLLAEDAVVRLWETESSLEMVEPDVLSDVLPDEDEGALSLGS
jgi:hypothetical protein